jgi:alkylhydroperoxidase family enzyme
MTVTPSDLVADESSGAGKGVMPGAANDWHHPIIHRRKPKSTRALLRRWRDLKAIYVGKRIEPGFREEIMLSVAAADTSRQCSFAHQEWALAVGVPKAEIAALKARDATYFDGRKWTAFTWAQAAARSDFGHVPDAIDADFRKEFGAQEQSDIELLARLMYWMNETSNGVDAAWERLTGKPVEGSALRDVEAIVVYAFFVPYIMVILSARQKRDPVSLMRGMRPFFREFEQRVSRPSGPTTGPR